MGVTRKYIHGCIYVLLEKCFQICDLREASRCARVDSLAEMERTEAGCVCVGDFQYAYLRENSGERVIFSGKKGKGERKREGERTPYKWDGEALQILSSVNSHDPHSFRSLILSRVWHDEFAGRRMPRCHRVIVLEFISAARLTLHDTTVNTASY